MIDFKKVKLIIWDLDETLWHGTLSDEEAIAVREDFVRFINDSLDKGIVHSICSKNDYDKTRAKLEELKLWDLFVFPSINWEAKGARVEWIIQTMNLRAANVLFIDDNLLNLQEAMHVCKELTGCTPEELQASLSALEEVPNANNDRKRLRQYKVLEEKTNSKASFSSNEEFLYSCDIRVEIHSDCEKELDRIHELILRSNQLNFTKFRQDKEGLGALLKEEGVSSGYVTVSDKFGEYGLVGFFAVKGGAAVHYLFSCRTLGMMVEQYVYKRIGCPKIQVVGDVVVQLNNELLPPWINAENKKHSSSAKMGAAGKTILFKGPCDVSQIFSFIEESEGIYTDFTYVNDKGTSIEGHNHTAQIVTALTAEADLKRQMASELPWFDEHMLSDEVWARPTDVIVLSMLTDGALGVYKRKGTEAYIALCEKYYDLTDRKNWAGYIGGEIFSANIRFTEESLERFASLYEYVHDEEFDLTVRMLDILYARLEKSTKIVLLLGPEQPFKGKAKPSYEGRELVHQKMNERVRSWAADKKNVYLIEIGSYIHSQSDYADTITHFAKKVYYEMAEDIISIAGLGEDLSVKSRKHLRREAWKQRLILWKNKLLRR